MSVLTREAELQEIVRILGVEALSESEKHMLNSAYMIKEGFLKQDSYNPVDVHSLPPKQYWLLKVLVDFYRKGLDAIKAGVPANALREMEIARRLPRLRMEVKNEDYKMLIKYDEELTSSIESLKKQSTRSA
jgi:Archaeal/vacuolar-type H+-ATPase subunit A